MNRRLFLGLMGLAAIEQPTRRVYSFLWDNPLVELVDPMDIEEFNEVLKAHYLSIPALSLVGTGLVPPFTHDRHRQHPGSS